MWENDTHRGLDGKFTVEEELTKVLRERQKDEDSDNEEKHEMLWLDAFLIWEKTRSVVIVSYVVDSYLCVDPAISGSLTDANMS